MDLISFGDSFVEGLIKEPNENSIEQRDEICFTRKIYENSNLFQSYTNCGLRGIGNEAILYNVYKHASKSNNDNSFYLICLSGLERVGHYDITKDEYLILNQTRTYRTPIFRKNYKFEPIFQTQMLMTGIHHYLKNKNILHLFTSSFTPFHLFYNENIIPQEYIIGDVDKANSLFDIIADRFNKKVDHFGDYSSSHVNFFNAPKNTYIADCLHPSIEGHKLISTTLLPYIEEHILKN